MGFIGFVGLGLHATCGRVCSRSGHEYAAASAKDYSGIMSGFRHLRLERVDIRAELVALIVALVVRELGDSHTVLWGQ